MKADFSAPKAADNFPMVSGAFRDLRNTERGKSDYEQSVPQCKCIWIASWKNPFSRYFITNLTFRGIVYRLAKASKEVKGQ